MKLPLQPQVEAAFAAALELPEGEQQAFLAREYPGDQELQAEVESLLRAWRAAGAFLEPAGAAVAALPANIGRYRILRLLGEGAMGAVYEAEQEQPRRTVALKIIKPGLASSELLRRFEQESQALGRLQHTGIAQIYEAGAADSGFGPQPYFAMEFIRGESLLQYAGTRQPGTRQRLELMAKVCEAVHHAHQRGIIHRDLKPGNILVDESGQPKVLDFGVARLTGGDTHATRQTDLGRLVGTLAYMSPEQALADPLELDTRSDVYALGVILFELLAGRLPYKVSRRLHEAVHTIREEEPLRLGSVNRAYRGDIETIAAKALEKDRARRYSSAAELAADIQRYLRDEPIVARRSSAAYQLRKFARRHKALVAGVAAVFVVLIAGIVTTAWQATLARSAARTAVHERDRASAAEHAATQGRDRALSAERAATEERNRAVAEKKRADIESATAKAVNDFLQGDLLAQASASAQVQPGTRPDPDLKVRVALDRAAARIADKFDKQPVVEASIRQTMGVTYMNLGQFPEAERQMERALQLRRRALGEKHPDTLTSMTELGQVYRNQGKYALAEPLYTKSLEIKRRVLGAEHPETLIGMNNLAVLYQAQGKYAQAEPIFTTALETKRRVLGKEHASTVISANALATLYRAEGKYAESERLFSQVIEARRRMLGDEHPSTLNSMNSLGSLYMNQNKYAECESLFTRVLEVRRRVLGEQHPDTLDTTYRLGVVLLVQGKLAEAEPLLTKSLELRRRVLGEEHPATLISMNDLARLYQDQSKDVEASQLYSKALDVRRRVLGAEHPETLDSMYGLARLYMNQSKYAEAESLYGKVLEARRRRLGRENPATTQVLVSLGQIRLGQRRFAEAESLLQEALNGQAKSAPEAWERYDSQSRLGGALAGQGKYADAEPLVVAGYEGLIRRKGAISWENRSVPEQAGERIVQLYQDWGKPEKVAEWREKLQATTSLVSLP